MLGQMDAWFRELGLINDYAKKTNSKQFAMIPLVGKSHICPLVTKETIKQFTQLGCTLFDCSYNQIYHVLSSDDKTLKSYSNRILLEIQNSIRTDVGLAEILWTLENKIKTVSCPYTALKIALREAEIVITTYPFLLNPNLREILVSSMHADYRKTTIVVDEAHNLAQSTFGNLSYKIVEKALNEVGYNTILGELESIKNRKGLHTLQFEEEEIQKLEYSGRKYLLQQFQNGSRGISNAIQVCEFIRNLDHCYLTADKKFELYLKDPRTLLNPVKEIKQLILISGTFQPLNQYADFLGVPNAAKISAYSEGVNKNRIILTTNDSNLSMKYVKRTKERYIYYSDVIRELAEVNPGHVLVFTPNYIITTILANLLATDFYEKPNQNISKLISSVKNNQRKAVIIAPARGKISEGVEIVKDDKSLISSVIVAGLPYPPPSRSLNEIIKEYSKFWGREKAINYMNYLQGIVTMRQCLGRMIRSDKDIGAWIILDNRISNMDVFPKAIECKNPQKMIEQLKFFFQSNKKNITHFYGI